METNTKAESTVAARAETVKIIDEAVINPAHRPISGIKQQPAQVIREKSRAHAENSGKKSRGEFVLPEKLETRHHQPKHQRRLFRK